MVLLAIYMIVAGRRSSNDITYARLRQLFEKEQVTEFAISDTRLTAKLADGTTATCDLYDFALFYEDLNELVVQQKAAGIITDYDYHANHSTNWLQVLLPYVLAVVGFILLLNMMSRMNGGAGNDRMARFGEARIQSLPAGKKKVTFRDVAGADEEKEELQEIVSFLRDPQKFLDLGAHIPKGVLLIGPPGTGKTLLAKAVAGEADVGFLSISGSDFVEMYVGVGASRVRSLFEEAKKQAPAIVFIDEIDAVGRQRGSGLGGGHDEREQTLNQLLVEMDGFATNEGVVVLAATNRVDILDPALLRPGRFDRQVYVGLPDIKGREEILKIHARNKPLADDVDLAKVARGTPGFTGADLENLLNEAALLSGRRDQYAITSDVLDEAVIKVIAGPEKRSRVIPERERKLTAYHEAGHAIVMHALPEHDPVHQITIVPRGQAGGMTISLPDEDRSYLSREYMLEQIVSLLGGRAAEQMILGDISTGAANDIQRATAIARKMVGTYGMSERLGTVAFDTGHDEVFIGKSMAQTRPYSEKTAAAIDEEIRHIIDEAYGRCRSILTEYRRQLVVVAEYLLRHETMTAETFERVFTLKME
ncbi:MAG: ATP-dependent zinc metalloprotease FtsH [Ruminococcaceae bacterium]|nr:ATP-dependent zinc metalloprotease FtsH [Oscillospiraceae bacterium]